MAPISDKAEKMKYDINYTKQYQRQFMVKVNRKLEPELVTWLESKENVQAYIKELIRKDMETNGQD